MFDPVLEYYSLHTCTLGRGNQPQGVGNPLYSPPSILNFLIVFQLTFPSSSNATVLEGRLSSDVSMYSANRLRLSTITTRLLPCKSHQNKYTHKKKNDTTSRTHVGGGGGSI